MNSIKPDAQRVSMLLSGGEGLKFDLSVPIDICPDCYAQRDTCVPLISTAFGSQAYFRLPGGERLKDAPKRFRTCFHCLWQDDGADV